ncbi:hypothetical protein ACFU9Y_19220 [Streptomyces sp. NPDC057621]|uniref:hypothetical protein n=1 Tax=Streptomyces sp. NPDC057621 TaxID=3346186 RepID=UPI00367DF8CA
MSEEEREAKERLAEALEGVDDRSALIALRWSLVWSVAAVGRLARSADAVEAVFLLDDALTEAGPLAAATPGLLRAAKPGPDVEGYVDGRQRELAEARQRIADCRRTLDRVAAGEKDLRARLAEHEELRAHVTELRHLERLVEVLDEIEGQREVVERRVLVLREHTNCTERAVENSSGELLRLTQERLSRLAPEVRTALERAAREQAELAAAEEALAGAKEKLAAASAGLALVRREHEVRLAELDAHAQADRRLTEALAAFADPAGADSEDRTAAERAGALVDGVEEQLREVDAVLRDALDLRDRKDGPGRAVVGWNDEGPSGRPAG